MKSRIVFHHHCCSERYDHRDFCWQLNNEKFDNHCGHGCGRVLVGDENCVYNRSDWVATCLTLVY